MSALTTDNTIATPILLHIKHTPHPRTPLRHPLQPFLRRLQRRKIRVAIVVALAGISHVPGGAVVEAG